MQRCFGFLFLALASLPALGQRLYRVAEFSPKYYGRVWLAKPSAEVSPGWVAVYERKTGRQLLKMNSKELDLAPATGETTSAIWMGDFNLDGVKDLAIASGVASEHGTPYSLYRIYLAQGRGFTYSKEFSQVVINSRNTFEPDVAHKSFIINRIQYKGFYTSYDYYVVRGNRPHLLRNVWDSWENEPYYSTITTTWHNKKRQEKTLIELDPDGDPLLAFTLRGNAKRLLLFDDGRMLRYTLLKPDKQTYRREVEFCYPAYYEYEAGSFKAKATLTYRTLEFSSGPNTYCIYESLARTGPPKIGVIVTTPGRTVVLPGIPASRHGSLERVIASHF